MKSLFLKKYKLLLLLALICGFFVKGNAQLLIAKGSDVDTELWTGLDFSKEITKKIDLNFSLQTRLRENISIVKQNFGQIGLSFPLKKISKKLKAATSFRFTHNEEAEWLIRPIVDIVYGVLKNDNIGIDYRMRFQKTFENSAFEKASGFIFYEDFYWRNRITLKYRNLKNIKPFISVSLFNNISRQSITPDQFRIITGFSYKVNKKHDLKLSYIYREKFNIENQRVNHIISAKLYFEVKDFKKKSKKKNLKEEKLDKSKIESKSNVTSKKKINRSKPLGPHRIEP